MNRIKATNEQGQEARDLAAQEEAAAIKIVEALRCARSVMQTMAIMPPPPGPVQDMCDGIVTLAHAYGEEFKANRKISPLMKDAADALDNLWREAGNNGNHPQSKAIRDALGNS